MSKVLQKLTTKNSLEDMVQVLSEDGVFIIEDYLDSDTLQELHDYVLNKCKTEAGHYEFGRNYRGPALSAYPTESPIYKVYDKLWMKNLYTQYVNGPMFGYGKNVFATHDYKYEDQLARNGWLHFDRNWCLKFFLYLTDIDQTSGAFSCSVGSRSKGNELRKAAWNTNNYEEVLNRIDLDYPELASEFPAQPIEAKAGTLIVFDTDTFHKGGKCEEGKERLVVRLHCG